MNAISCENAQHQFFAYLDRTLADKNVKNLKEHLEACLECCDRLAFSRKLDSFVRSHLNEATLPAGIEERINRALTAAAAASEEP
jgi:hypothetical protein